MSEGISECRNYGRYVTTEGLSNGLDTYVVSTYMLMSKLQT